MAKSDSGRIVLEVNPELKRVLYGVLALENKSLKDWFIKEAEQYIEEKQQTVSFHLEKTEKTE